nr:PEP-CTERM sorting domain-containing protein [Desulfobacula sp.]
MKNKLLVMVLAAVIQAAVLSGSASAMAVSFPDWDNPAGLSVVSVTDPQDWGNARDILGARHATDGEFHYFRMDLAQAPGTSDYAGIYGIYIDAFIGGSPASYSYLPNQAGIDYALDSHYNPNMAQDDQGFFQHDFHQWNNGLMQNLGTPVTQQTANGSGYTLEWIIGVDEIGSNFSWFAATHDFIEDTVQLTWDRTSISASAPVPAPSAGLLFASALLGLSLARRKQHE